MARRTTDRSSRGFTLVELMITVAIIAVLAALAVYGVRRYILVSKTAEPIEIINSIRAAQESYKDETFRYLNVSSTINTYHPATPDGKKRAWDTGGAGDAKWKELGVRVSGAVEFGYACVAGGSTDTVPSNSTIGANIALNYPATAAAWYVVKAAANRDGDSNYAILVGSSFTNAIHVQDEDE